MNLRKYPERKEFYETLFHSKESSKEIILPADARIPGLELHEEQDTRLGLLMGVFVHHVQYIMIGQTRETKERIIKTTTKTLIFFLQTVFNHLYPTATQTEIADYWDFIKNALKKSLSNYDEETCKKHMETICFYACLHYQFNPSNPFYFLFSLFQSVHSIVKTLNLNFNEKYILSDLVDKTAEAIVTSYNEVTAYNVTFLSLVFMGGATAALCFGVPYAPALLGVTTLSSAAYAWARPKLTEASNDYFFAIGKKVVYKELGQKFPYHIKDKLEENKQHAISKGIQYTWKKLLESTHLTRATVPSSDLSRRTGEVYALTYSDNAPSITDLTSTQRKKLKGKKPIPETVSFKEVADEEKTPQRQIQLPAGFNGTLIECANHSLLVIKPPDPSLMTPEELNESMGPRGATVAKKFGQSGFKMLKGNNVSSNAHRFWIKDVHTNERIWMEQQADEEIDVNGQKQKVPAFKPVRFHYKTG